MKRNFVTTHPRTPRLPQRLAFATLGLCLLATQTLCEARSSESRERANIKFAYIPYATDLHTKTVSKEAFQLAEQLKLADRLREITRLRASQDSSPLSTEQSVRFLELREQTREVIEQTRLEVDYVDSEIVREEAVYSELLQAYTDARDRKVDKINAYGFRTNGVLWAIGEALDIPTYASPKYAIPSGALGIVAGLVPSAFSLFALHQEHGGEFERDPHPNMLSKIFGYDVTPEIDYPDSIWTWLNSVPPSGTDKTRLKFLVSTWQSDINLNHFSANPTREQLDRLTATRQTDLTIRVISDRLVMIRSLHAVSRGITRPLLELFMVVSGSKVLD